MRKSITFGLTLLWIACAASAQDSDITHQLIDGVSIQVPAGYSTEHTHHSSTDSQALKFTQGPTDEEIKHLVASGELDEEDAELFDTVSNVFPVRTLQVIVIDIPASAIPSHLPPIQRDTNIYDRFGGGFTGRWGEYSFCHIHEDASATSCINTAGAFIAVHSKLIGQKLVSVEAIDFVASRQIDEDAVYDKSFHELPTLERWTALKAATNGDAALSLLATATLEN